MQLYNTQQDLQEPIEGYVHDWNQLLSFKRKLQLQISEFLRLHISQLEELRRIIHYNETISDTMVTDIIEQKNVKKDIEKTQTRDQIEEVTLEQITKCKDLPKKIVILLWLQEKLGEYLRHLSTPIKFTSPNMPLGTE